MWSNYIVHDILCRHQSHYRVVSVRTLPWGTSNDWVCAFKRCEKCALSLACAPYLSHVSAIGVPRCALSIACMPYLSQVRLIPRMFRPFGVTSWNVFGVSNRSQSGWQIRIISVGPCPSCCVSLNEPILICSHSKILLLRHVGLLLQWQTVWCLWMNCVSFAVIHRYCFWGRVVLFS